MFIDLHTEQKLIKTTSIESKLLEQVLIVRKRSQLSSFISHGTSFQLMLWIVTNTGYHRWLNVRRWKCVHVALEAFEVYKLCLLHSPRENTAHRKIRRYRTPFEQGLVIFRTHLPIHFLGSFSFKKLQIIYSAREI